ncbi:universal stress protein [Haloarchaeobius amylolyticus]|uniref:universal stress protein n=1 Tax=Haloarchaeobius amylolyticus TaxID=1198296 RepID=UPI0022710D62|nr:universal stress protein [Haloarchaeobius amylolyticus]
MFDRLLVPTDGSDVAQNATEYATGLARRFGAEVHLVWVLTEWSPPLGVALPDDTALVEAAEDFLDEAAESVRAEGVDVTTQILESDDGVADEIVDYAESAGVEAIVMGTEGRTGIGRLTLGSTTESVLRQSELPVFTVREETDRMRPTFDRILAPTDGSKPSLAAVDHAASLAVATGATLDILHVMEPAPGWDGVSTGALNDALEEAGENTLDAAIDRVTDLGVSSVERSLVWGVPHSAILRHAEETAADCIVMGTRGRSGLTKELLGSVTQRVVRRSPVPVVGLHGPSAEEQLEE